MPQPRSFKSDESFLQKLAMGATGTSHVMARLDSEGHQAIELERGSTSFKIWKAIKIKRIRVPDILCVKCGLRVESRAKTKPEISMSHSAAVVDRGWDYGLDDEDYVAIAVCAKAGSSPIDWTVSDDVSFLKVADLRAAWRRGNVVEERRKGAEEGFESRLTWPSAAASAPGEVVEVGKDRIRYRRDVDGRLMTVKLEKRDKKLAPLVSEGARVVANQILACVCRVATDVPCTTSVAVGRYIDQLKSVDLSDRYAAAKAIRFVKAAAPSEALKERVSDAREHVYVKLEAAATLAALGVEAGIEFLRETLHGDYLENQLEAVIILGEVADDRARDLLLAALSDQDQHPEIRAGAAWALGEIREPEALAALISSFASVEEAIRTEAARALAKLAVEAKPEILNVFPRASSVERAGIAWALGKAGNLTVEESVRMLVDDDARRWAAWILGSQGEGKYVDAIERLRERDSEVYFAVTVLWQIMSSWVYGLEEY